VKSLFNDNSKKEIRVKIPTDRKTSKIYTDLKLRKESRTWVHFTCLQDKIKVNRCNGRCKKWFGTIRPRPPSKNH